MRKFSVVFLLAFSSTLMQTSISKSGSIEAVIHKEEEIEKRILKFEREHRRFYTYDQECKQVDCGNKYGCDTSSEVIKKVAFSASRSEDLAKVTIPIAIVFDVVSINIGNMYSPSTGDFSCFSPGVYVFYVKIMADGPFNAVETHLMKNDVIVARTYSNVTNSLGNSGTMAVTQLDVGDRVWVRLGYVDDLYGIDMKYTSFSGFLLY